MKVLILVSLLLCVPALAAAQARPRAGQKARPAPAGAQQRKIFPYQYHIDDLPNGLRLVTVPTDFPNLVALYIVVQTGSRNEVEPGKSGYAHFFEHLMFRGSKNFTAEQRDEILKRAGASSNAYTTDDRTVYHEVFDKSDLDKVMEMEADRFQRLQYTVEQYKTEAGAVRGEYDKNSASPFSKLHEKLRETAFKRHTYAHTTMGYIRDIQDFPNQYDYSLEFYRRYYRPEYTTILLVGDVTRQRALALAKKYFGDWQRGSYKPDIPREPEQDAPREAHIDWPNPTLPYMAVAFRGPAYSDVEKDKIALDLLGAIAFGENSDIYQRLVLKEQKVDFISAGAGDQIDPELFTIYTRVKKEEDVRYVREQILATVERFTKELIPQQKLDQTRSRFRYGFAQQMDSSEAIARAIAEYVALRRTPETLNKVFSLAETVTPEDLREVARKYFREQSRTIVTLATKKGADAAAEGGDR
ncbi:MAG TPA: pitrilysin family protein [Pyrinomonadaceae bacterium]|nr:pitrilysin family protein [Pyrinomonadaceae bacterium]